MPENRKHRTGDHQIYFRYRLRGLHLSIVDYGTFTDYRVQKSDLATKREITVCLTTIYDIRYTIRYPYILAYCSDLK